MITRIITLAFLLFISFNIDAQKKTTPTKKKTTTTSSTKKAAKPKQEEVVEEVMMDKAVDEVDAPAVEAIGDYEVIEVASESYDGNGTTSYSNNYPSNRYRYERITDNISIISDKLSDSYTQKGLLKNGRLILPLIFNFHDSYYSENVRETQSMMIGIGQNVGIYNFEQEKWVVPMHYGSLSYIGNGLYSAKLNGKYGIIDIQQNIIVPFDWQYINKSSIENYYFVTDNKSHKGLLNIFTKKLSIPCIYRNLENLSNSNNFIASTGNTQVNILTPDNQPVLKSWYEELYPQSGRRNIIAKKDGAYGIIDENENIVVPFEYTMMKNYPYNDGSYLARNKAGKYGCIAIDGRITLPFEYDKMDDSYNSNLLSSKNNKCGIVQVNQGLPTEIVTCDYDNINAKSNVFIIQKNGKFGALDNFGKLLITPTYDALEIINPSEYDYNNRNMLFIARTGSSAEILSPSGKKIGTNSFKQIEPLQQLNDYGGVKKIVGLKYIDTNNKAGLLDLAGIQIMAPTYDELTFVEGSFLGFRQGKKYGVYNYIMSKEVMKAEFDQIIANKNQYIGSKGSDFFQLNLNDPTKNVKL